MSKRAENKRRKKFARDNTVTAFGSAKGFFRKTPEQFERAQLLLKPKRFTGGFWKRYEENDGSENTPSWAFDCP